MSESSSPRLLWLNRLDCRLRGLATYDLFPAFSAKVRRLLYNPLGVLILAALAAVLCGLFLHRQGLVLLTGIVTVILLGIAWPWLSVQGLLGSLSFGRLRASEGEPVAVWLTLHNRLPWSAWGLAACGGFTDQAGDSEKVSFLVSIASVPGWRTTRCRWSFTPACRGIYPRGAPHLTTGFPFGLWENKRTLTIEKPLLVWPRTVPVGPVPLVNGDRQVEGNVSRNKIGSNGDVLGVRPYRRGDAPRRIHWGQSARHDRLIICELQSNARPVIQLVLDTNPRVHAGTGPASSREWAIRIVASLAKGWLEAGADERGVPPRFVLILLLLLVATPFLLEPFRRWTGVGYPLELQMVFALRNLGLGLAARAAWLLCLRLACVVSLFLMLFALSMTNHPGVLTLLGLYSAAGNVWLMLTYWTGLRQCFADSDAAALEVQTSRARLPWLALLVAVGLVSSALSLVTVGPERALRMLGEWLPTSGGTDSYDPFARGGINDGDDEVKGNNARSTGTMETDLFLDSPLPSLYDIANDLYGPPFKKPKAQERAIPLDAKTKVRESEKPSADNQRPNREFATARKGPRQPRDSSDRAARALFEVQGRTPLHVRVTAFDACDGRSWQEAPRQRSSCLLDKERDSCWMSMRERQPGSIFAENQRHQFKITRTLGSLVPTPPHTLRFRVGRVDQAIFFAWGQERILRMAQRQTPFGIVVETESRNVDPRLLADVEFPPGCAGTQLSYGIVPANLDAEVSALAHRWAGERPRGWTQIAAIIQHLRTEYVHDPSAHTPEGCDNPLRHFLTDARRGPDYQFATGAAVLLRVLGYPTRLVCGFYVSPEHYDSATHHTPVVEEDLHFWAEVMLTWGDWLVIEPTPGYEVLVPSLGWSERLWGGFVAGAWWLWDHAVELCLSLLVSGGMCWWRRELLDALGMMLWRWFPGRSWQQCVRRAMWLLEWRGRWAGQPRRACQTTRHWLHATLPEPIARDLEIDELIRIADWAIYAADLAPPWKRAEVQSVCSRALNGWTFRRWRKAISARAVCGA